MAISYFRDARHNGAIGSHVLRHLGLEIQYDGHYTEITVAVYSRCFYGMFRLNSQFLSWGIFATAAGKFSAPWKISEKTLVDGKPEVVVTSISIKMSTRFQQLSTYFRCHPIEYGADWHTATSTDVRKLRWQIEAGSGYNFGLKQNIDATSMAVPILPMTTARM
jgi:hypothetical protein